jgi:excisionase family DNA binding protein
MSGHLKVLAGGEEALMTPAEVAIYVRRTEETIRRWARSGRLRQAGKLPGGGWLFARADVDALIGREPVQPAMVVPEQRAVIAAQVEQAYARADARRGRRAR